MRNIKSGIALIVIGLLFNMLETWYFGWNMFPHSVAEVFADTISGILMFAGIVLALGHLAMIIKRIDIYIEIKHHDSES